MIAKEKEKIAATTPAISLPADQYAHAGAPTEWWWHVGTLVSADGRKFGFEINAASMFGYAFTQIEITDVQKQCNYQKVNAMAVCPTDWAQYDQSKPWYVKLSGPSGSPSDGLVSMTAINNNPLNMAVQASFMDAATNVPCQLNLNFLQQGPPLLVWGTGCHEVNPQGTSPITRNNYYYSLTNLQASGTITIGNEIINVTGLTWMDHEYGAFPNGESGGKVIWLLQDIQLSNGMHLTNSTQFGIIPQENVPIPSNATLLLQNGESVYVETITTPMGPTYTSAKGIVYFLNFKVEIKNAGANTNVSFLVSSSYPDQVFRDTTADVYEGVGTGEMLVTIHLSEKITKQVLVATGPAWIEQNLG